MSTIFKSGEEYTLSQLFSEDRKIIIPDLQRDYCWGDKVHGSEAKKVELISGFLKGLINSFNENNELDLILGLIYGYENPINHIHLCDGQQRITTLFLLLGMLHRKNGCKVLNNHLISSYEYYDDDKEPYLQYSIRESTLYFLSDLVCNFFLNKEIDKVEAITEAEWYFNSYDEDPSIQSMLSALLTIEKELNKENNWKAFQYFIENKIKLLYYDLENRENGEDLFVIINTTGEPLTATENLKPILLGSLSDNIQLNYEWEIREEFFWKNKMKKEYQADEGLFEFISWFIKIQLKANDIRIYHYFKTKIDNGLQTDELLKLHDYYYKFINLIGLFETPPFENVLSSIRKKNDESTVEYVRNFTKDPESSMQQQNILLPLLYFSVKISEKQEDILQFLRRLRKNYFDKQRSNREGSYLDWRYLLQIIEKSNSLNEVLEFTPSVPLNSIANVNDTSSSWFNLEEKIKSEFIKNVEQKQKIEEWEDHLDFKGDISPLLKMCLLNDSRSEIPLLLNYIEYYKFEDIDNYYNNYLRLENLMIEDEGIKFPVLANYYRLFKVIVDCNNTIKVPRTTGIKAVTFSKKNRKQLYSPYCLLLYKQRDPLNYIKNFIKDELQVPDFININIDIVSCSDIIKKWLIIKVLVAEDNQELLTYWNGRKEDGVSIYSDLKRNVIFPDFPAKLSNIICGFALRSGGSGGNKIEYTNESIWNNSKEIATTFAGIKSNDIYWEEREYLYKEKVIKENEEQIIKVINKFKLN